jgi:hypothetical protein
LWLEQRVLFQIQYHIPWVGNDTYLRDGVILLAAIQLSKHQFPIVNFSRPAPQQELTKHKRATASSSFPVPMKMASPTRQDGTESDESWIRRLPLDIRTDIAQLGARGLGRRQPILMTRAALHIHIRKQVWMTENCLVKDTRPTEYRLEVSRTREQHEALHTWLTLCNKARTAALGTETFVLDVVEDEMTVQYIYEDYRRARLRFSGPKPRRPQFEGAVRDLVLNQGNRCMVDMVKLFTALHAVFGANLQRIHVLGHRHDDMAVERSSRIASTQTERVYFLHEEDGEPMRGMERILRCAFSCHPFQLSVEEEINELAGEVREGEFDDEDAKVFELPSFDDAGRRQGGESLDPTICYGEIIRQYSNEEIKINKGLKSGLREGVNDSLSAEGKGFFRQVVTEMMAKNFFPSLEYVSLCGLMSNQMLEDRYQKYHVNTSN